MSYILTSSALLLLLNASTAFASLYMTQPVSDTTCYGGQSCTVQWLDDGETPSLSEMGVSTVGLYSGEVQLVQSIEPVDVSTTHSLEFTPDANAGPNSDTYYIVFTSLNATDADGAAYQAYSHTFTLANMQGSFSSVVASDTSTIPVPSTVSDAVTQTSLSTTFIGTPSSAASSIFPSFTPSSSSFQSSAAPSSAAPSSAARSSTSSGFSTSVTATGSASASSAAHSTTSATSSALSLFFARPSLHALLLPGLFLYSAL